MSRDQKLLIVLTVLLFLGIGVLRGFGYDMGSAATSNLTKIHPSSYFILLITFFNSKKILKVAKAYHNSVWYGLLLIVLIFIYLAFTNNLTSVSFIIDTLLSPMLILLNFKLVSNEGKLKAQKLALNLILINSIMAIIERAINYNFLPITTTYGEVFRSTALLGHPLNNALITCVFILFTLLSKMKLLRKSIYLTIMLAALVCYGARGALYTSFAALVLLFVLPAYFSRGIYFRKLNKAALTFLVGAIVVAISYLIFFTPFGERLVQVSFFDDSAAVRVQSIDLIDWDNLSGYFFAKTQKEVDSMMYMEGVNIIENFFVGWILKFGIIIAVLLVVFYYRMFISTMVISKRIMRHLVIVLFFAAASTNNSLVTGTQVMSLFVLMFCSISNRSGSFESIKVNSNRN
ncbi:MAG: hypothetical protein IPH58_16235 [Sphingobacteriales bacterium]|jgi:hypothetical protein|nr:hypothetical protein [Sphingobacteriales bacterium]